MVPKEQCCIDSGSSVVHLLNRTTIAYMKMHMRRKHIKLGLQANVYFVFCVHYPSRFGHECIWLEI